MCSSDLEPSTTGHLEPGSGGKLPADLAVAEAAPCGGGIGRLEGHCPQGAVTVIQREAAAFDEEQVRRRQVCPGTQMPGDGPAAKLPQIWETLEGKGLRVGAFSPMNAGNATKHAAFFVPDPWTQTAVSAPALMRADRKSTRLNSSH